MSDKEMREILADYCAATKCSRCIVSNKCKEGVSNMTNAEIEQMFAAVHPDKVNHPAHYCREGAMECFDEMLLIFGKQVVADFCLCNAWKYRYRAADKGGAEDLKKSDWYMNKYRELTDSVEDIFR